MEQVHGRAASYKRARGLVNYSQPHRRRDTNLGIAALRLHNFLVMGATRPGLARLQSNERPDAKLAVP